jgi:hypothetical protein
MQSRQRPHRGRHAYGAVVKQAKKRSEMVKAKGRSHASWPGRKICLDGESLAAGGHYEIEPDEGSLIALLARHSSAMSPGTLIGLNVMSFGSNW